MFHYKIVQAELWGNAKDGFDTNDWFTLAEFDYPKPMTGRWLLRLARNHFEGRTFNWSEKRSTAMSRDGIELGAYPHESMIQIEYRGYYIGEIQIEAMPVDSCDRDLQYEHLRGVQA